MALHGEGNLCAIEGHIRALRWDPRPKEAFARYRDILLTSAAFTVDIEMRYIASITYSSRTDEMDPEVNMKAPADAQMTHLG